MKIETSKQDSRIRSRRTSRSQLLYNNILFLDKKAHLQYHPVINRIYIEAAIEGYILTEVDDWIEDDDAAAHVQQSEAQKRWMR